MPSDLRQRRVFTRLSIAAGNAIQLAGLVAGWLLVLLAARARIKTVAVAEMLAGILLIYLSCHAIAHWFVGRVLGIRFRFYTVGGAGDPQSWPMGLRWLMAHAPFFGVQTDKASIETARPIAKAALWSAGVTSSAVLPTLAACWTRRAAIPGGKALFIFMLIWSTGTLVGNIFRPTGDFFKARMALKSGLRSP
ncbi:MAG TPA: hypothetical protein VLL05_04085 [Terriglobales bacterium]|nr:hypothetical protein [Terriglobales bacterium]